MKYKVEQVRSGKKKKSEFPRKTHIPWTETKVKVFVSDIPSHTNQNIGIF